MLEKFGGIFKKLLDHDFIVEVFSLHIKYMLMKRCVGFAKDVYLILRLEKIRKKYGDALHPY